MLGDTFLKKSEECDIIMACYHPLKGFPIGFTNNCAR
nr:MAG TPA: hypothetical protein [Microviridae sp.]